MKVSKAHYATLEKAITEVIKQYPTAQREYKDKGLSDMRYRWDCYWIARRTFTDAFKDSMHAADYYDDHLDTAFRRIIKQTPGKSLN